MELFFQPYLNTPYKWCLEFEEGGLEGSRAPFWRLPTLPTPEELQAEGCCCVGVVNLWRIHKGKSTWAGTGHIADDFPELEPMDKEPEEGAMLLRRPRNFEDQGHVGIVLSGERYLHCFTESDGPGEGFTGPGIVIEASWKRSHAWIPGKVYYDGWVKAEKWM